MLMTKPKKPPPNIPERGDKCAMRRDPSVTGVLLKFDPESEWATVEWNGDGPKICHRFELVKV
jgi:hypothetical protein